MEQVVMLEEDVASVRDLLESLRATLRAYLDRAQPYQRFAYGVGVLLLASALFHTAVLLITGGPIEGPVSWRKPILFGEAFGLTLLSVAWVLSFLPKRPIVGWFLMAGLGIANLYEVAWVSLQQWRGVPSHFNYSTPFDERLFTLAGGFILITASVILIVTLWALFSLQAPRSLAVGILAGMLLLLAGQVVGLQIINNGNAKVIDPATGAFLPEMLARAAIFGEAGSMKVPHALSLHGIQALPILALLLRYNSLPERRRTGTVLLAGLGYGGLLAVSLWQAYHGRAFLDLDGPGLAWLVSSGLLLVGSYGLGLLALSRSIAARRT